ncbi:DEAD/DEAH box helicase [soil metagenome]
MGDRTLSGSLVTFIPETALPARGRLFVYRHDGSWNGLASDVERLGWPTGEPASAQVALPEGDKTWIDGAAQAHLAEPVAARSSRLVVREVVGRAIDVPAVLPALLAARYTAVPAWRRLPDSARVWGLAGQLAVRLVASHHVAPTLVDAGGGAVHGVWRALVDTSSAGAATLDRLAAALPPAAHAIILDPDAQTVWPPEALLRAFLDSVADHCARGAAQAPRPGRPRQRLLPWTARWVEALADNVDPQVPLRDEAPELLAGAAAWHAPAVADAGLVELRLASPEAEGGTWRLDVGVRLPSGTHLPAATVWDADQAPTAAAEPGEQSPDLGLDAIALQETLLRGLGRCARIFAPLDGALKDAAPQRITLDVDEAWDFIRGAVPLLAETDIIVVLPDDLVDEPPRLRLRIGTDEAVEPEDVEDLAALWGDGGPEADYRWEVALGDDILDDAALGTLLASGDPLVRWGDRWVRAEGDLRDRLDLLRGGRLPLAEALLFGLAGSAPGAVVGGPVVGDDASVEVVVEGRVAALLERLHDAASPNTPITDEPEPPGFVGELRGYQRRGVAWLGGMASVGLGGVLADDMGLGKTIQMIAYYLKRDRGPYLVVCPTSVVGNWERELARFAPDLEVTRFHGPERPADLAGVKGVVVTSYGVLRRDAEPLVAVDWDVVALDEAQHIKNPETAGAKQARRLPANQVVALTGTPLENRLAELWSLLDVTNRGLLGSRARFGRRFVAPIERRRDPGAAARLRRVVAPFVLRRGKRDPEVRSDLPDKIERTVVCALTAEQAKEYTQAVDRVLGGKGLSGASAMERRGRVLALLTALKQICNHPAQYTKELQGAAVDPSRLSGRSGKLAAAREIIAEATSAGDQVLVFTQFVEMGHLLVAQLAADLGTEVPFLHGGVSARGRDGLVAAFQGEAPGAVPPVLVVSLRAGGTGLNLTAATHVLHYDRWWNPAVEDQATDRAHRIGQLRTVEVHKLVTAGTVEERIADLLERKRALADSVVGAGERWITEMGEDDLRALVALSAPGEDLEDDDLDDAWATGMFEEARGTSADGLTGEARQRRPLDVEEARGASADGLTGEAR